MQDRILVIKLSALGDFILALGAMEALRRHHRDAHITLLTTRPFVDMAQRSRYFDDILVDARPGVFDLPGWLRLFRTLNAGRFSRVYDLQNNDRTRLYARLFLRRPLWTGETSGKDVHAFRRHGDMLARSGIAMDRPDLSWMEADVSLLEPPRPYVLLIPGAAPRHPRKRWPAVRYAALALRLTRAGYGVAVLGGPAEAEAAAVIRTACPAAADLSGKTSFYDIAALARGAAGAVGNDTGPTHLVSLSGCPVTALFSDASDPVLSAPVGPGARVIQADDLNDVSVDDVMKNISLREAA